MGTFAINFSRPAGQVAAQYYLFNRLGFEGYKRVHSACYETALWISDEIEKLGPFTFINRGAASDGIPASCFRITPGHEDSLGYNLYDLSDRLSTRGWQVPAFQLMDGAKDIAIMRLMVRQGVSRDMASLLIDDMKRAIEGFKKRPVPVGLTEKERGAYSHN